MGPTKNESTDILLEYYTDELLIFACVWLKMGSNTSLIIHIFMPNYHEDRLVIKGFHPIMNPLYLLLKAVLILTY